MRLADNTIVEGIDLGYRLGRATPRLQSLAYFFRRGHLSSSQRELLEIEVLRIFAAARANQECALFEVPSRSHGELKVGVLPNGQSLWLTLAQLALGVLIIGSTGAGKTFVIFSLLCAIFSYLNSSKRNCGIWLVDHQKFDLELSVGLAERQGLNVGIVPNDMPINPLEPPTGVPGRTWAARVLLILEFVFTLSETAVLYLRPVVLDLYERIECPTWLELLDAVTTSEEIPEVVKRPVVLKLQGIASDMPRLASTRHGYPIEELERRILYWPLSRMPRDLGRLVYAWARWASFCRRAEQRVRVEEPDLFVIEDETSFAYSGASENEFIGNLCAVGRSSGIAFIAANQRFDLLPSIVANSNTKFVGRVSSNTELRSAADILSLNGDQARWLASCPKQGQFVAKLPSGHLQPFPFMSLNPAPAPVTTSQRAAAERLLHEELGGHVVRGSSSDQEVARPSPAPLAHRDSKRSPEPAPSEPLGDTRIVLENCNDSPYLFISERAKQCGLNANRMNEAKKELLLQRFVVEHELETLRPGARPKLLEITEAGSRALRLAAPAWNGRPGGYLHNYGKHLAARMYARAGYRVQLEAELGHGRFADVLACSAVERVGVEVQCAIDHALENLRKLEGAVHRIEFLCFTAPVKSQLEALLPRGEQIRVHHFARYLDDLHGVASGNDDSPLLRKKGR